MAQTELWLVALGILALMERLGLGLYLSGISRCKNAATAMTRTVADLCVAVLAFWAVGHAILSGRPGSLLGLDGSFGAAAFFNATIILIATGAALGGILERTKSLAPLLVSALLAGLVVPLAGLWAWSGWLARLGFVDVGGACVLHVVGGLCAGVGAMVAGPRGGKYNHDGSTNLIPGHSFPQTAAGAMGIFLGLLAQIAGCAILRECSPAVADVDSLLAAAAGGMAALLLGRIRYGITDAHFLLVGLLGGLVAASASAGRVEPAAAVLIGAVAGLLTPLASVWLDLGRKIDDPAAGVSIHFVGGLWGLLAGGLLLAGPVDRLRQLAVQATGAAAIGALALVVSAAAFLILRAAVGLRPSEMDETYGNDLAEHDMNAYPDFQQTTIKSYHLRET